MTQPQNQTVFTTAAEACDFLRGFEPDFLERAPQNVNGCASYICPVCGNGSGAKGDGIARNPRTGRYKCFVCGLHEDYAGLYEKHFNLERGEALRAALARNGASLSSKGFNPFTSSGPAPIGKGSAKAPDIEVKDIEPPADYREYYKAAAKRNEEAGGSYLLQRGISLETQKLYGVGYDPAWRHPEHPGRLLDCVVYPMDQSSYSVRTVYGDKSNRKIMSVGRITNLFGEYAIMKGREPGVIFITEGPADAMSIYEAGGRAVALNNANGFAAAVNTIRRRHSEEPGKHWRVVICLDDDKTGRNNAVKMEAQLREAGELCVRIPQGTFSAYDVKDANELLLANKEALVDIVRRYTNIAEGLDFDLIEGIRRPADDIADMFQEGKDIFEVSSGFAHLDEELFGGLREGLYIIGAISSLGKTTFCLQLADQIAESGQDVLFFSLEMSERELASKTLSRFTYQLSPKGPGVFYTAMTSSEIMQTNRYSTRSPEQRANLDRAKHLYKQKLRRLYIHEGRVMEPVETEKGRQGDGKQQAEADKQAPSYRAVRLNCEHIRTITKRHYQLTGRKPVVFIDYLQILAPLDPRSSDKQATDVTVSVLKELSRELSIPVIAVSSFNRDNYTEPVSMVSFKESGAIEYSSDVLFGLQYRGMEPSPKEGPDGRRKRLSRIVNECRARYARKEDVFVDLKCLKNRSGKTFRATFRLMAAYNSFAEVTLPDFEKGCPPACWEDIKEEDDDAITKSRQQEEKRKAGNGFRPAGGDIPDSFK